MPDSLKITEDDKDWVEHNFKWLIDVYGYPSSSFPQYLITEKSFPESFHQKEIDVSSIINDLAFLLELERKRISFELIADLRDTYDAPYEIHGAPFETDLEIKDEDGVLIYRLIIANSLTKHPGRLMHNLISELIKIRLSESNLVFDAGDDTDLFVSLAGVFHGFGVILSQGLNDSGIRNEGIWERKWNYSSIMPAPIMAFSLALFSHLINDRECVWKTALPSQIKNEYESAAEYFLNFPSPLYNERELMSVNLRIEADSYCLKKDFSAAIETFQKALFLTNDEFAKSTVYNNIGYYQIRKGEYSKSISNFQAALKIWPSFGYANDNLGFAFIMMGDLETGKFYIDTAMQTNNNDDGYSYRNLALYYQQKKDFLLSEEFFLKAFNSKGLSIDLLEYFYALFLFDKGEKEKGLEYLEKAVAKGEPEAIKLKEKLISK